MEERTANQAWRRHQKPWWEDVFSEARQRGWSQRYFSSHKTYKLLCPSGECETAPIFSSGNGSESVAKSTLKLVRRCPHAPDGSDAFKTVEECIEQIDRLLDAARTGLDRRDFENAALRALDHASAETVDELLNLAQSRAVRLAALLRDDEPEQADGLLNLAEDAQRDARSSMVKIPRSRPQRETLRAQLTLRHETCRRLRERLIVP